MQFLTFRVLLDGGLVPSSATKLSMIEVSQSRGDNDLLQLVVSCGNTPQQSRLSEDTSNRYLQRGGNSLEFRTGDKYFFTMTI